MTTSKGESQDWKKNKKTASRNGPGKVSVPFTASLDWNRKYPLPQRSRYLAKQRLSQPSKVLEGRTKTQTPQRDVACLIYGKHRDLFTSDIIRSASYLQGRATTKKLDTVDSNKKTLDLFWCSHSETAMTHSCATTVCQTKTRFRNGKKACDMGELHGLVETKCWKTGQVREWRAMYQKHSNPAML